MAIECGCGTTCSTACVSGCKNNCGASCDATSSSRGIIRYNKVMIPTIVKKTINNESISSTIKRGGTNGS